jgi:L,D-transpeptidase ErfK/SrfK
MGRIIGNSELGSRARLVVAVLILSAARLQAQEQQVDRRIIVSLADRKLALIENGEVSRIYPVAVGKLSSPSPTGEFKIVTRVINPTYYRPGQVIAPGAENPVGTRWIGLNQQGYGIHGTNVPQSIGKAASHGCIRMAKEDIEELFEIVRAGDLVEIRGDRDDETAQIFGAEPTIVASAQPQSGMASASSEGAR